MRNSVYIEVFNLFAAELKETEENEEMDMILSTMSHLVAWKRDKSMNILVPDHYFLKVLLPEFEKRLDAKLKTDE